MNRKIVCACVLATWAAGVAVGASITQICPTNAKGNGGIGYVVTLGEGHFVLIDGNGDNGEDHLRLLDCIKKGTPEGMKPVVDCWVITHPHWDHIAGAALIARTHAADLTVKEFLLNFPPLDRAIWPSDYDNLVRGWQQWLPDLLRAWPKAHIVKAKTGETYRAGGAALEILHTQEDIPAEELMELNNASIVFRMTLAGKTVLFTGDVSGGKVCRRIKEKYGAKLKSDGFQAAHHGWNTECWMFYDEVNPSFVLWPTFTADWDKIDEFPMTKRLKAEMADKSGVRKIYAARGSDITVDLQDVK